MAEQRWKLTSDTRQNFNPLYIWNHLIKYENVFVFSLIPQYWGGTASWNLVSWKTRTSLSYVVNTMAQCWWPAHWKSHRISNHFINLILLEYFSISTTKFYAFVYMKMLIIFIQMPLSLVFYMQLMACCLIFLSFVSFCKSTSRCHSYTG